MREKHSKVICFTSTLEGDGLEPTNRALLNIYRVVVVVVFERCWKKKQAKTVTVFACFFFSSIVISIQNL